MGKASENGDQVLINGLRPDIRMKTSDTQCGIGPFKPNFLQVFSNILSFTFYYGFSSLVTSALSMYLTSQVTTLEKQFGLSSSETGMLLSMNDIGFLTFVLFVSHFSRNAHKPRILGACVFVFGLSALVSSIPHFISSEPNLILANTTNMSFSTRSAMAVDKFRGESMCFPKKPSLLSTSKNFSTALLDSCSKSEVNSHNAAKFVALGIISAGMFFQGVAKSPRMALTQTYIDDNVIKTKTGLFIGIIACLSIFGPATAFAVGAQISRIYVTLEETTLTVKDPRWIGAWWLGFLVFGFAALAMSGPLFLFPRRMVIKSKHIEKVRLATKLQQQCHEVDKGVLEKLKDMPLAIWRLFTNYTYMSLLIATSIDFFSMAGSMAFAPKYFEVFFGLSIFKANMLMGTTTIVAASTGMLAGGIVATKFKLKLKGCIKFVIVARTFSGLLMFVPLFMDCPPQPIVGLAEFGSVNTYGRFSPPLNTTCSGCSCTDSPYFPVCGSDGRNYYSPCVAGCSAKTDYQYTNCTCVLSSDITGVNVTEDFAAVPGLCSAECPLVYFFVAAQVFSAFLGTMSAMPGAIASMRSVTEKEKTFSIGMASFVHSLLGWTLGPIVFGYIIDGTCILWHSSCSNRGSCAVYDVYKMRNMMNGIGLAARFIFVVLFILCLVHLNFRPKTEESDKGDNPDKKKDEMAEMEKMLNDKTNELEPVRISSI